jgi:hypothetical protein
MAVYARVVSHGKRHKIVTIPIDCDIDVGEYVRIEKVE